MQETQVPNTRLFVYKILSLILKCEVEIEDIRIDLLLKEQFSPQEVFFYLNRRNTASINPIDVRSFLMENKVEISQVEL